MLGRKLRIVLIVLVETCVERCSNPVGTVPLVYIFAPIGVLAYFVRALPPHAAAVAIAKAVAVLMSVLAYTRLVSLQAVKSQSNIRSNRKRDACSENWTQEYPGHSFTSLAII